MEDQDARRIAWLRGFPQAAAAVTRLRPAARERFMMQLRFSGDQLAAFSLDELRAVLPAQARQALLREILLSMTPPEHQATLEQHLENLPPDADLHVSSFMLFGTNSRAENSASPLNINGVDAEPYDIPTLRRLHKENLLIVFDALCMMEPDCVFTGQDRRPLLLNALRTLELRRMATLWRLRQAQAALLRAGCYEQAGQLTTRHPKAQLPAIPHMRSTWRKEQGPSAWRPTVKNGLLTLQRDALDLTKKRWWVASRITYSAEAEALATLLHEDIWKNVGDTFGGWLTQPPGCEPIDALPAWHLRHPATPAWPAGNWADWPFPNWITPILFVAGDGDVLEHIQIDHDPARALIDLLKRHNLSRY
ncbi:hypothetical protein [Pseudoxanthomonas sp.]|uniref:hypothetical protein n=1 Tax=Pseudoxanthomonas sp. TaxID=1871049 RepID=UPI00261F302F|nr:hypothetical protein [Pseudoxanthomonas sp.]WDS36627.1 MAG: hypothetical protein O8I58_01515 [Pseudoxanthomonas sp.]